VRIYKAVAVWLSW